MEHQKILNLLNEANNFKFVTRKWIIVNDNPKWNYGEGKENTYNTELLKFNFCDYIDIYVLLRGGVTFAGALQTQEVFKHCAPFNKCITNDGATTGDVENLDLVMPMYTLIEYSSNYSKTTGSSWFYSRDKATNFNTAIVNTNNLNLWSITLNYLEIQLLRMPSLKIPLINFKVELKLTWTKYCFLSAAAYENNISDNANANIFIFTIKDTYFSESNFVEVNRLFVLAYTNKANNAKIFNARKYYLPEGIIKNYNLIVN